MSRKNKAAGALVVRPGYEVGYGWPPQETRFQKGKSGNPKGRPKGKKNNSPQPNDERMSILIEEAYRGVTVRDGDKNVTIPTAQAVMRSLAVNAAKGQHRTQRLFTELLSTTERQLKAEHDLWLDRAIDYKVHWEKELAYRAAHGLTGPEPLPHLDHIIIDTRRGTAEIVGPLTKEEKMAHDKLSERKNSLIEDIAEYHKDLAVEPDERVRTIIRDEIAHTKRRLDIFRKVVPGFWSCPSG